MPILRQQYLLFDGKKTDEDKCYVENNLEFTTKILPVIFDNLTGTNRLLLIGGGQRMKKLLATLENK